MIAAARSRRPGVQSCSDMQTAGPIPSRLAVGVRESNPTHTNKIVYLRRKLAEVADFGFVGMDFGRALQTAAFCRNNAGVVDR
jgi:hypothetical protein